MVTEWIERMWSLGCDFDEYFNDGIFDPQEVNN